MQRHNVEKSALQPIEEVLGSLSKNLLADKIGILREIEAKYEFATWRMLSGDPMVLSSSSLAMASTVGFLVDACRNGSMVVVISIKPELTNAPGAADCDNIDTALWTEL